MTADELKRMSFFRKLKVWQFFGSVPDICLLSNGRIDYHDYKVHKGGGGQPQNCHQTFSDKWQYYDSKTIAGLDELRQAISGGR